MLNKVSKSKVCYGTTTKNISDLPLKTAYFLLQQAEGVELSYKKEPYYYSAIILSTCSLENFINEIFSMSVFAYDPLNKKSLCEEIGLLKKDLKGKIKLENLTRNSELVQFFIRYVALQNKIKRIAGYLEYNISEKEFWFELDFLITLRNELVHHKMRYIDEDFSKYEKLIRNIFSTYKDRNIPLGYDWPSSYLTKEGAEFSIDTIKKIISSIRNNIGIVGNESGFVSILKKRIQMFSGNLL